MLDKSEVHKNAFAEINTELVKKNNKTWPPPYPKGGMDDFKQAHNIFSLLTDTLIDLCLLNVLKLPARAYCHIRKK